MTFLLPRGTVRGVRKLALVAVIAAVSSAVIALPASTQPPDRTRALKAQVVALKLELAKTKAQLAAANTGAFQPPALLAGLERLSVWPMMRDVLTPYATFLNERYGGAIKVSVDRGDGGWYAINFACNGCPTPGTR